MSLEKIKSLKIPSDKNAILYLWATAPKLDEALGVIRAWGFDYRTCLVWDKKVIGMGYWFRGQHELLLVGVKGKFSPPEPGKRVSSVLRQKRGEHSKKPIVIRRWINEWYPNKSKIELFARKEEMLFEPKDWKGWDVWGNEVENDIDLSRTM